MTGQNNEITVYRLIVDGESKESYDTTAVLSDEPCYIEPIDAQVATILDDQNAFYMFKIFCEGQLDIRVGDKCIDQQGRAYIVKGIEPFSNNPDTGDMTQMTTTSRFPS